MSLQVAIMYLSCPVGGRTEEYFWNGDGTAGLGGCEAEAKDLVNARRNCLAQNWTIDAVAIRNWPSLTGGRPYYAELGCGPGLVKVNCINPWNALIVTLADATMRWKRRLLLGGLPDEDPKWAIQIAELTGGKLIVPPNTKKKLDSFLATMNVTAPWANPLGGNTHWALAARADTGPGGPLPNATWAVTKLTIDPATGLYVVTVNSAFPGAAVGAKVHLHMPRSCNTRGLSGDTTVRYVDLKTTPGMALLTLNKLACCGPIVTYGGGGKIYQIKKSLQLVRYGTYNRLTKKNLGRARYGTEGRGAVKYGGCLA